MGYDMRWESASVEEDAAEVSYFGASSSGMNRLCSVMAMLGMMRRAAQKVPDWPTLAAHGVPDEMYQAIEHDYDRDYDDVRARMTEEDRAKVAAYQEVLAEHLRWHGGAKAICTHKFETNDGWIVTPEECRAALATWQTVCNAAQGGELAAATGIGRAMQTDDDGARWLAWVRFIEGAAEHGGFRVH